jgi:hypothetical protein
MAYNEALAARLRKALANTKKLTEKKMFGGIVFMVDDKMCLGVNKDVIMMRCQPDRTEELLSMKGANVFDFTGKPMKGWLVITEGVTKNVQTLISGLRQL